MFPWAFFLLVFALSVPFWVIGAVSGQGLQHAIRINLPISSLMTFNPLIAVIVTIVWGPATLARDRYAR